MKIHCKNCEFEGAGKELGGFGAFVLMVLTGMIGLIFWPFLLVAVAIFIHGLFSTKKYACPTCGQPGAIPLKQWDAVKTVKTENENKLAAFCGAKTQVIKKQGEPIEIRDQESGKRFLVVGTEVFEIAGTTASS